MCIFQCFHLFLKLLFHVFIYAKFKSQLISFYFIAIFHTKVLYFGLDLDLGCVFFCLFIYFSIIFEVFLWTHGPEIHFYSLLLLLQYSRFYYEYLW